MSSKFIAVALLAIFLSKCRSVPVSSSEDEGPVGFFAEGPVDLANTTVPKDLYVIKTIVYEVGILTEAGNDTGNSTETNEEIDLTFFNPSRNGSIIDLNHIPIPIQTNISGVSITGIAPVNFGTLDLETNSTTPVLGGPLLPNAVIKVSHNVSTFDSERGEDLINKLSPILGIHTQDSIVQ